MKKKVLVASYYPGGANALAPVVKRLQEEGKVDVVTVGYKYSERIFHDNGISYRTLDSYGLPDASTDSMKKLLEAESPDLVITSTASEIEHKNQSIDQLLIEASSKRGIKSLSVLDFWGNYNHRRFKKVPDKIAVIDDLAKETMMKDGFNERKLVITGNPYFDDLAKLKDSFSQEDKYKVRKYLNFPQIDADSYLLLYASQPIEKDYGKRLGFDEKTSLKELLDSVERLSYKDKTSVLVKIHPREDEDNLKDVVKGYSFPIVVNKDYRVRDAVLASDVVVSPFSTVLVEAAYLDKPGVSLQPGLKKHDMLITNHLGFTVPVYRKGDVGSVIDRLLMDKKYARQLAEKRKGFVNDGKATDRVLNLVYEMLNFGKAG